MYVGIDIGGTNIRVAYSPSVEALDIRDHTAFLNTASWKENKANILRAIKNFGIRPTGIGIGTPGRLNADHTKITHSLMIAQWIDKPLVETLQTVFECPVVMNGDQYCGALSEALLPKPASDFMWINYGTGIGAARVSYTGDQPRIVRTTDEEHAVYLRPWQEHCSGKWLEEAYGKLPAQLGETEWDQIMDDFYGYFLKFLRDFSPGRVVFGGGMAIKQWPRLQTAVFDRLQQEKSDFQDLTVQAAHYKEDAPLVGAFMLLR